jgi:hypothetical protein
LTGKDAGWKQTRGGDGGAQAGDSSLRLR